MPRAKLSDAQPISATQGGHAKLSDAERITTPGEVLPPEPTVGARLLNGAEDLGKGALEGAGNTLNMGEDWAARHLPPWFTTPLGQKATPENSAASVERYHQLITPANTTQAVGKGIEQAGEFLLPTGVEKGAANLGREVLGHGGEIAGKLLGSGVHSGLINKAQGGDFGTGAAAGAGGAAIGEGMRVAAPLIAESALGVRGADKMYGRTVGNAIMEDTHGVRPSTIEESARGKIGELKPELEQAAADAGNAGGRGSLLPARQGVDEAIAGHLGNRATKTAGELEPLRAHLANDSVTGLPLAQDQTPTGLLQLKRGVDSDFIRNWSPLTGSRPALGQARQAYGNLADEFHSAAPGTQELDQRISSLIPVANRAEITARSPGVLENTLNRFRVPTGALTGAVGGGAAGYHEGGLPGAVAGAGMGALLPSVISSPTTQMVIARGLYDGVPKLVPALSGGALQLNRGDQ